jgi:hypothetical protein
MYDLWTAGGGADANQGAIRRSQPGCDDLVYDPARQTFVVAST